MILVDNVTKRFGQRLAVDHLSFEVREGEILGFLGPNGAGKSTTLNIITGCLSATEGSVHVGGHDVLEEPLAAKRLIGFLPEQPPLYLDMTVREYLGFVAQLKGLPPSSRRSEPVRCMQLTGTAEAGGRLVKNLSKGYRQRIGLAQALLGSPPILILDEPTIGLDPRQIIEIRELIRQLGSTHTIILSSHILPEVSAVCNRVLIIDKGRLVASDAQENLSEGKGDRIMLRVAGEKQAVLGALRQVPRLRRLESQKADEAGTVEVLAEAEEGRDVRRELSLALGRADLPILMMRPADPSLEEIFLKLVTGQKKDS
jgi:ABC-2 type transport system ATP-binding protein